MKKMTTKNLESVCGGATISSTVINAFTSIFKLLMSAGEEFGSSIRRISEDKMCPLK